VLFRSSENVTEGGLKGLARKAATKLARAQVFSSESVDPAILERVAAATPELVEKRVRAEADASSEVTLADRAPYVVSIAIAFILWTLIFSVVNYLLMGTIEERSNKIFDALLTSVSLPHLLAGKLLAVLAVSLTLMAVWGIGGTAITVLVGTALPSGAASMIETFAIAALDPAILLPALFSFLLGYLMYGALFLALGSLCDTIQEAQTLMTPLLVLLMVPLFMLVIAIENPESAIINVMSWVPVFTPFLLILRMPTEPPLWEVASLLALMGVSSMVILWLATRVYRAGAVHGAGVNDALAWMKNLLPGLGKTDS
jgi:ABC-2 type transport system permease protein